MMSEFENPPERKVELDPESVVLHALAILQHEEALVLWRRDEHSLTIDQATDHLSHWYNANYRQLGRAVDEATGLSGESAKRRRENITIVGLSIGSSFGCLVGGLALQNIMNKRYM